MEKQVEDMQMSFFQILKCDIPVITAIHGYCIGAGIDLICYSDIRICEENT